MSDPRTAEERLRVRAEFILDRPHADPDDDAATMARGVLRLLDRALAVEPVPVALDVEAAKRAEGRVVTDHLTVPNIIETYAARLCQAYPDNRADFIEERDDLLAWWAATPPEPKP